jgi:hypothetical protein
MKEVVVVGAGKIGATIADMLTETGDYAVTVVDRQAAALDDLGPSIKSAQIDLEAGEPLTPLLAGKFAVMSAAPFHLTTRIAQAANDAGVHYMDLTEDVASTRIVKKIAAKAKSAFVPQCGLAPGFISIVANDLAKRFDSLESVRMRVGALPQYPSNALNYNLTWSTDGVINEYCEPCEAVVEGELIETPPLEEREEFSLDGITYEAFNTSGGLGTLAATMKGKVRTLNYKHDPLPRPRCDHEGAAQRSWPASSPGCIEGHSGKRPAGHLSGCRRDLRHGLGPQRRTAAAGNLRQQGLQQGQRRCRAQRHPDHHGLRHLHGARHAGRRDPAGPKGFVRQEEISLDSFLANRFGQGLRPAGSRAALRRNACRRRNYILRLR